MMVLYGHVLILSGMLFLMGAGVRPGATESDHDPHRRRDHVERCGHCLRGGLSQMGGVLRGRPLSCSSWPWPRRKWPWASPWSSMCAGGPVKSTPTGTI